DPLGIRNFAQQCCKQSSFPTPRRSSDEKVLAGAHRTPERPFGGNVAEPCVTQLAQSPNDRARKSDRQRCPLLHHGLEHRVHTDPVPESHILEGMQLIQVPPTSRYELDWHLAHTVHL